MEKPKQIKTYNALKGIGAIGILFSHMSYLGEGNNLFWKNMYSLFMNKGSAFCSLFVLLSGFFLNYTWKDKPFRSYLQGKLKRVYPLTLLVFIMALVVELIMPNNGVVSEGVVTGSPVWFFNIVANIFLFKAFIPYETTFYSFHGPSWYISVLFGLYIIAYPFVRGLHGSQKSKWVKCIRRGVLVAYVVELVLCVLVNIYKLDGLWLCYVNPWFRIFGEGFAGILICEYVNVIQSYIKDHNKVEWVAVLTLFLFIILRNVMKFNIMSAWAQIIPMGLLVIAFRQEKGRVSRLLKRNVFQFIGGISFELYMTHAFVYEGMPVVVGIVNPSFKEWLIYHAGTRFIITVVLCVFVAWIVRLSMKWLNQRVFTNS